MRMHAAVARGPQLPFDLVDVELDEPRPNEVLVKLTASGICHTDLIIRDGWFPTPMPAVLGHEGAGVVERVGGDVTDVSVGDRVVLTYSSCHQCSNCLGGAPAYCADFWAHNFAAARPDGSHSIRERDVEIGSSFFGQSSFAQYAVVDHRGVIRVDAEVDLRLVGPLGCGIQTGAGAVLNSLRPQAGTSIAVFGAGAVGLSAIAAASDASTRPRSSSGDVPFFNMAADSPAVRPSWSDALRRRSAPAWPTSPLPPAVTFRARSHPLSCMAKSAPVHGITRCGNR